MTHAGPTAGPTAIPPLVFGFDFYGAGNIGDDLSIAGFLAALRELRPGAAPQATIPCPWDIGSQRLRFPEIDWARPGELPATLADPDLAGRVWAGVGGTPFQHSVGSWLLEHLRKQRAGWGRFGSRVMVNVGAESEIGSAAAAYAPIARELDRISTRDPHTTELLTSRLGVPDDRLFTGADLAHAAMPQILEGGPARRSFRLGLIAATYMLADHEVEAIGTFLSSQPERVAWLANDVRPLAGHERQALMLLGERFGRAARDRAVLLVPPYDDGSLRDLVAPTGLCDTVLSSRYHGLLAAAWAGGRVGAFGGASKVESLARELDVPTCPRPLTPEGLAQLARDARPVARERLESLRRRAVRGVAFALGLDG